MRSGASSVVAWVRGDQSDPGISITPTLLSDTMADPHPTTTSPWSYQDPMVKSEHKPDQPVSNPQSLYPPYHSYYHPHYHHPSSSYHHQSYHPSYHYQDGGVNLNINVNFNIYHSPGETNALKEILR